ncbi:MAG TPA: bi-domain-containing oxidoreductase [Candidatus Rifleibacterium sp.]|nr:bi-domain-containing oxidoreductase [Candidatus Rifleibacterium sp.]HPT46116.1 bi-domain-containing oxidoreductase [Candidatus Rifleibacterium sp.]
MKQILQSLKTGEIELAELPVPGVRPGSLLIRTNCSLISLGTERMLLNFGKAGWVDKARQQPDKVRQVMQKVRTDGLMPTVNAVFNKLDQPLALGYSNAGVVLEVGAGVFGFKPGDRVVSNGNHAEVVCIPANLCARIPDGVDDTSACFTVVSAIALEGMRLINPTLGESIAVIGLGLIGLLTCQILLANGCRVIGFDFDRQKVELARDYGVTAFDISHGNNPVDLAMNFSRGHGVDGVIITASTTSNDPAQQAPQMCRKRGRVVLVGVTGLNLSRDDFYKKEISFQVSCSYGPGRYASEYEEKGLDYPIGFVRWTEQRNFEAVLDLMDSGKLRTRELVSREIPLAEAGRAYELVAEARDILGLVLTYDGKVDLTKRAVALSERPKQPAACEKAVIGFIGAGNYAGSTLIPAFAKAGATLKTIASSGGVSGNHVGSRQGFAISTTDTARIFNDPEINTVVIATRHGSHARFIIEALNSGRNVFVEKPLCLSFAELAAIKTAWEAANSKKPLHLMVGFNRRFSPLTAMAAEKLRGGNAPCSIIITVNAGQIPAEHWVHDFAAGGGRVIGEACHFIDLVRFLTGQPLKSVTTSIMSNPLSQDKSPDTVSINLICEDGSIGTVHYFANGSKDFPKERLEIFSQGRIMQIDNFKNLHFFGWPGAKSHALWAQDKGHEACAAAFVRAVEQGLATPISFAELNEVAAMTLQAGGLVLDC